MKKDKKDLKVGDKYVVPKEGSLGLMALGYKGIMMWRSKIQGHEYIPGQIIGPIVEGQNLKIFSTEANAKNEEK